MDRLESISHYVKWTLVLAICAAVLAVSASSAFAQTPFDSQYGPPTEPPCEEGSSDDCAPAVSSDTSGSVVEILPTTGGVPTAALLLAGAGIVATTGIIAIRRRR